MLEYANFKMIRGGNFRRLRLMKNRKYLRILDLWLLIYVNANFARIITPLKSRNSSRHSYLLFSLLSLFSILSFRMHIAEAQSLSPPKPYTLQIGDAISVTVEGYPEYSKQIVVRLDGYISKDCPRPARSLYIFSQRLLDLF